MSSPDWAVRANNSEDLGRKALRLIRARAACSAVFVTMALVIVLIDFGIPLRSLQILAVGAATAAMGFHHWAESALTTLKPRKER